MRQFGRNKIREEDQPTAKAPVAITDDQRLKHIEKYFTGRKIHYPDYNCEYTIKRVNFNEVVTSVYRPDGRPSNITNLYVKFTIKGDDWYATGYFSTHLESRLERRYLSIMRNYFNLSKYKYDNVFVILMLMD